jgi:hypothetical protein
MRHIQADERLALIEAGEEPAHPHLARCARCRAEVAEGRAVLRDARLVDVPEPSPLFWDALSRRVSGGITEAGHRQVRSVWPFWRALIPLTVGVVALLIAVGVDRGTRPVPAAQAPAAATIDQVSAWSGVEADDGQWVLLGQLAADFDLDTLADSLGSSGADGADSAVWQLSERERAELAVLLRAELQQQP